MEKRQRERLTKSCIDNIEEKFQKSDDNQSQKFS